MRPTGDVIRYPDDPPPAARWSQPVVALGNFDGVHRGHAKILEEVRRRAAARRTIPAVLTFDPHPSRVVRPDRVSPLIMTTTQKLEAFAEAGMAGTAIVRFTKPLSQRDRQRFVRTVLVEWLQVGEVYVGLRRLACCGPSGHRPPRSIGGDDIVDSLDAEFGLDEAAVEAAAQWRSSPERWTESPWRSR